MARIEMALKSVVEIALIVPRITTHALQANTQHNARNPCTYHHLQPVRMNVQLATIKMELLPLVAHAQFVPRIAVHVQVQQFASHASMVSTLPPNSGAMLTVQMVITRMVQETPDAAACLAGIIATHASARRHVLNAKQVLS